MNVAKNLIYISIAVPAVIGAALATCLVIAIIRVKNDLWIW